MSEGVLQNCFECGAVAEELHHVVPQSVGGTATVPLCSSCHGNVHGLVGRCGFSRLVKQGQAKARAEGKHMGRPHKTSAAGRSAILQGLASGATVSSLAREYGVSRATIINIRSVELELKKGQH